MSTRQSHPSAKRVMCQSPSRGSGVRPSRSRSPQCRVPMRTRATRVAPFEFKAMNENVSGNIAGGCHTPDSNSNSNRQQQQQRQQRHGWPRTDRLQPQPRHAPLGHQLLAISTQCQFLRREQPCQSVTASRRVAGRTRVPAARRGVQPSRSPSPSSSAPTRMRRKRSRRLRTPSRKAPSRTARRRRNSTRSSSPESVVPSTGPRTSSAPPTPSSTRSPRRTSVRCLIAASPKPCRASPA